MLKRSGGGGPIPDAAIPSAKREEGTYLPYGKRLVAKHKKTTRDRDRICYVCRTPCTGKRCRECHEGRGNMTPYKQYTKQTTKTTERICRGGTLGGGGSRRKIPKNGDEVRS